ncbi:MAG: CehA/McbA family metallohydrolase [Sarcina sp.]
MSKKNKNLINLDNLNFSYGVPHCHSNISTGDASLTELLLTAYKNSLDFLFITDHNDYIASNKKDSTISTWQDLNKLLKKFNRHNNFIAIAGFEAKSSNLGHFNVINSKTYFQGTIKNFNDLLIWMLKEKEDEVFISINHPHKYVSDIPFNEISSKYVKAIEVGNGLYLSKYTNHENHYFKMLDLGWKVAAINGQDNHKNNVGAEENLTCAITKSFDKESLLEAFKNLHVFSTESKSLKLIFMLNSTFMGETYTVDSKKDLDFFIQVEDPIRKIEKVEVLSNNKALIKSFDNIELNSIKILFNKKINEKENWYVVKITLLDKRTALSSPIFLTHN